MYCKHKWQSWWNQKSKQGFWHYWTQIFYRTAILMKCGRYVLHEFTPNVDFSLDPQIVSIISIFWRVHYCLWNWAFLAQVVNWGIKQSSRYLSTLKLKLWDLAALELKFRFLYANYSTCSQIDVKYNKHCTFFCKLMLL